MDDFSQKKLLKKKKKKRRERLNRDLRGGESCAGLEPFTNSGNTQATLLPLVFHKCMRSNLPPSHNTCSKRTRILYSYFPNTRNWPAVNFHLLFLATYLFLDEQHILDTPRMSVSSVGFCPPACHCEKLPFFMSRIWLPVSWRTMQCSHGTKFVDEFVLTRDEWQ